MDVIQKANLVRGFANSLLYALVATVMGVIVCAMAAFVLSRSRIQIQPSLLLFLYHRPFLSGELCNLGTCFSGSI